MNFPAGFDVSRVSGTIAFKGSGGPKTPEGKAIAARNATTHGLFARDIVLTQLGEDPTGYETLHLALCEQIDPQNLIEQHYVEEIAAASWRLRRLHRWQAQVYEDLTLTEDQQLDKLDRVLRHETALHRQIDKSVRQLGRDVPALFEGRARKQALAHLEQTERSCRSDESIELDVALAARDCLHFAPLHNNFDRVQLDNTHPRTDVPAPSEICQNELPAVNVEKEESEEEETETRINTAHSQETGPRPESAKKAGRKKRSGTRPPLSSPWLSPKKHKRTQQQTQFWEPAPQMGSPLHSVEDTFTQ